METTRPRIIAAIEAPFFEGSPPWPWRIATIPAFRHFRVHAGMTLEEVGSLVAALIDYRPVAPGSKAATLLQNLTDLDYFGLRGGLAVTHSDRIVIRPGRCSGLEKWREWQTISKKESPWMGHDPTPWCQFLDDGMVRFWAGGGYTKEQLGGHADMTQAEVTESLKRVHNDLREFLRIFRRWLRDWQCDDTEAIVAKFDRSFAISQERPAYLDSI